MTGKNLKECGCTTVIIIIIIVFAVITFGVKGWNYVAKHGVKDTVTRIYEGAPEDSTKVEVEEPYGIEVVPAEEN